MSPTNKCATFLCHTVEHIFLCHTLYSKCATLLSHVPHFYIVKQLTFSGSLSHYFLSGSLLYVLCSTPFPLHYLLSLNYYFVSVYISLFYTFGGPEKDQDLNYIHSFTYKVYFTELYYKHIKYKVIFTNTLF